LAFCRPSFCIEVRRQLHLRAGAEATTNATLTVERDRIRSDFAGRSTVDPKGINCPLVYACYALKCEIAPEIANTAVSLLPFEIAAPENTILTALHPAPQRR
tara:strand:- start:4694 stop:4999 length:306 start_codon:yes stop_codon:yes gene_type:complete